MPLDDGAADRDGIHHARLPAAALFRQLEDVDDGVLDPKIDAVLQAPAHRGLELRRRHLGCLDQNQLVIPGGEHRAQGHAGQGGGLEPEPQGRGRLQGPQLAPLEQELSAVAPHDRQRDLVPGMGQSDTTALGGGLFLQSEQPTLHAVGLRLGPVVARSYRMQRSVL
jgi:hypothetical protein